MFLKFFLDALMSFQFLRKALTLPVSTLFQMNCVRYYLPWKTAPQQAASPAALQDVTEDTRRKKQEQHKKRRINHPTALTYYPGERCLGRKLRCCRSPFRRSESMGVMDNLSAIYI